MSFDKIGAPGIAARTHQSEFVLGTGVSLFAGEAIAPHRLGEIPRDTDILMVHTSEADLGACKTLLRGAAVPLDCVEVALRYAVSVFVESANMDLCLRQALTRSEEIPLRGRWDATLNSPTPLV